MSPDDVFKALLLMSDLEKADVDPHIWGKMSFVFRVARPLLKEYLERVDPNYPGDLWVCMDCKRVIRQDEPHTYGIKYWRCTFCKERPILIKLRKPHAAI